MPLVDEPWARVRDRAAFPSPLSASGLSKADEVFFAELLRQNLVPQQGQDRRQWQRLWSIVGLDDDLAARAGSILEDFLDQTESAVTDQVLGEAGCKRAAKFIRQCEDALARLDRAPDEPLGWAGNAASGFNPPARRVLEQLVEAIADHREGVTSADQVRPQDEQLWQILKRVDLDPRDHLS